MRQKDEKLGHEGVRGKDMRAAEKQVLEKTEKQTAKNL